MNRGEVWLAEVGRKRRPVLVLTRSEVLDVRSLVTVAEVSTSARGLAAEVELDHVFVPDELVLGSIGQGWAQNTSELAYERGGPDRWLSSYTLLAELLRLHEQQPLPDRVADVLGDALANYWVLHSLSLSVARSIDSGGAPAVESSLVKEMGTRFEQDVITAINAIVDEAPNVADTSAFARLLISATVTAPSFTIRGGTNEVLRSVAAKGLQPSGGKR